MGTLVVLAWRNLWRGWRRSAVVLVAITVGLSACLLLVGWSHGMIGQMVENVVATRLGHLAVHATGYRANPDPQRNLTHDGRPIAALIEEFPGAHAAPRLVGDGLLQSARKSARVVLTGIDPEREARVSIVGESLVAGSLPAPREASARALPGIAIGAAMAERLRVEVGDKVVVHAPGEVGLAAFRVSGVFRTASSEFDKSMAYLRLEEAQRLLDVPGRVTELAVRLDDPEQLPELQTFVRDQLTRRQPGRLFEVLNWREREPRLAGMLDLMANMSWIIYGMVFVAMAFGIANALLMAVYERIREFGVLRSLGLPASRLLALVLLESLLLTLSGVALGIAVGVPLVFWLAGAGIDLRSLADGLEAYGIGTVVHLELRAADLVSPILIAIATAVVAALWPAWKAVRLRPAEALRHV
jgi:ABC-type lipoprotein release transport system permease subunit